MKKTILTEFSRPRSNGKIALEIVEGDRLIDVAVTDGDCEIMLFSSAGKAIRFHENDVRTMGRTAAGVKGITLADDDEVVGAVVLKSHEYEKSQEDEDSILTVTENGFGKRTLVTDYRLQKRGGKGIFAIKTSERNGKVVGAFQVINEDQVMLIANSAKVIRLPMDSMRIIGRNTQGVKMINLSEGEKVVALSMLARNNDEIDNSLEEEEEIESGADEPPLD